MPLVINCNGCWFHKICFKGATNVTNAAFHEDGKGTRLLAGLVNWFPAYWTVFISTRTPWSVFPEALKTRPAGCGAMFTTKHP